MSREQTAKNKYSLPPLKSSKVVVKILALTLLCISTLLTTGCKSKKRLVGDQQQLEQAQLIDKFRTRPDYHFFNGKAKVAISSPYGSQKGTFYLRMQKDSLIWAVVKKLSVEGARLQIDSSQLTLLNRLEKTYHSYPLDTLSTLFGIEGNLEYLQDMMMGLTPRLDSLSRWETQNKAQSIEISSIAQNVLHKFDVDKVSGRVVSGEFRAKYGAEGTWEYDDYRAVNTGLYLPYYRKYDIYVSEDEYLSLEIKYSDITLDEPKKLPFSVPDRYTRTP